jgi:hypothetical protein
MVLLFPYREICTPQVFFGCDPLFLPFGGSDTRDFASPTVERYTLGSPRPDASVNADFFFVYRDFGSIATSLYRDFATRDTKPSDFQLPIPDAPKRRYDLIALSLLRALASSMTWSTQGLGPHLANPEFARSPDLLPPVFHSLLWSHTTYVTVGISHLATSRLPLPNLRHFLTRSR